MQESFQAKTWDRLQVFSFLFALSIIIHGSTQARNIIETPLSFLLVVIAALVVLNPRSLPLLFVTLVTQLLEYFVTAPDVSNHWLLCNLMALNILICFLIALMQNRLNNREAFFEKFAVGGRILVLLVFWIAAFHKLNTDFLKPDVSCAVYLYERVAEVYYLPQGDWVNFLAIHGTLVIEFALPFLLIFPFSRHWGVLLGLLFHLFLGMRDVYEFSSILYALYFLFLSRDFLKTFAERNADFLSFVQRFKVITPIIILFLLLIPSRWFYGLHLPSETFAPVWLIFAVLFVVLYLRTIIPADNKPNSSIKGLFFPMPIAAKLLLLICLVNGFLPYLGLKTNNAFEMYSNLQTENGQSNHLLIPASWQIFPYSYDVVEIISSNDTALENYPEENLLITRIELIRRVSQHPNFTTLVRYQGYEYQLPDDLSEIDDVSPILLWFLTFDAIELNEDIGCTW